MTLPAERELRTYIHSLGDRTGDADPIITALIREVAEDCAKLAEDETINMSCVCGRYIAAAIRARYGKKKGRKGC
jgi:hypothetical protein